MSRLRALVAAELAEPVDPRVAAMATAIAAEYGGAARAVLFYGSCLRANLLDGQMLDFYLIVSDYRAAYRGRWFALANRLVPPNVFPFAHDGLSGKYAVLSEADFHRLCGPEPLSVSVWARFAQPARLVWEADAEAAETVTRAVARAAPTLLAAVRPLVDSDDVVDLWRRGFAETYRAELRAERGTRADAVVDWDRERYARIGEAAVSEAGIVAADAQFASESRAEAERLWAQRRRAGKLLSLLRLAKASTTYAGGIDYLAWKINRHAGTQIIIRAWQRRWPILGALILLPLLLKRGAIR